MAQKINPTSNKLGVLKNWNYQFQTYGRTLKGYNKFIQPKNYTLIYIKRFLFQNNLLVESIDFIYSTQQITITASTFNFKFCLSKIETKFLASIVSYWLKCPVKILIYQTNDLKISCFLLKNYIFYLLSLKTFTSKQILQLIFNVLRKQYGKIKPVYTVRGLQLIEFKGFKLQLTGCFESSRSQMSKTLKHSFGSIPLTKLNGYIEYSNACFFTKFGSCGFRLWLFYELL